MKQKTALMMSIERKERGLSELRIKLEHFQLWLPQTKEESAIIKGLIKLLEQEIAADKLLLEKDREDLAKAYRSGQVDMRDFKDKKSLLTHNDDWFNQTFESHE